MSYDRPTAVDVRRALESYVETIDRAGELGLRLKRDGARFALEQGSKTYGRAWRLYETGMPCERCSVCNAQRGGEHWPRTCEGAEWVPGTESGYYRPIVGDDYLGMTAREAHDAITTRHRVVADVLGAMCAATREGGAK